MIRPFLKFVGGKRQLLGKIAPLVPLFDTYVEPFVGGGALFFHLRSEGRAERAVLADANERLIRTYRGVRDNVESVIAALKAWPHSEEFYLGLRGVDIDRGSDVEVAAWFIYLNKTGYNGLYRVNKRNVFNVPFGKHANPTICDEENLRTCAAALRGVDLQACDFLAVQHKFKRGDFVYFDPPYVPVSATSSFTAYTQDGFTMEDQTHLRDVAQELRRAGVYVLLSNSSAPAVRELYANFEMLPVQAARAVNAQADKRGAVTEYLIR